MARSERKRLWLAAAAALAVPVLVACNGILGLGEFEKVECAGGRCGDGAPPPDASMMETSVTDAPNDTRGADPVSWAQWPMPNSDGGGDYLPHPLMYQDQGGGVVLDGVTSLVWQTVPTNAVTYGAAVTACSGIGPSTTSWRVPKRIELVTLLDFGRRSPFIDPRFKVLNVVLWTSSEARPFNPDTPGYWTINFETGVVATKSASDQDLATVLCVQAKP